MPGQKYNSRRDQNSLDLISGHLMPQAPEVEKAVLASGYTQESVTMATSDICYRMRVGCLGLCV